MRGSRAFDVIVVGGGPGGSVAAKRCAEGGLNTVLIEKKRLPRDKVCTGMVMGDWARRTIRQEFGEIPGSVLVDPPHLSGYRIRVRGAAPQTLEYDCPLAWRKDLDFWMIQRAKEAGVAIRAGSKVVGVASEQDGWTVAVSHHGDTEKLRTRFVIGADGAISVVRRSILPDLKVRYAASALKCYRGALNLEKKAVHYFFPKGRPRPRFGVYHKNDVFIIEGRAIRELRSEIDETLEPYGFEPRGKPEWKDSGAIALMHDHLLSGVLAPAHGNVLLVGDAAGLLLPITFEGIGSALKSGIAAAESIAMSVETGKPAAPLYLRGLERILKTIRRLRARQEELETVSYEDPNVCAQSIVAAYRETLIVQSG